MEGESPGTKCHAEVLEAWFPDNVMLRLSKHDYEENLIFSTPPSREKCHAEVLEACLRSEIPCKYSALECLPERSALSQADILSFHTGIVEVVHEKKC